MEILYSKFEVSVQESAHVINGEIIFALTNLKIFLSNCSKMVGS